MTETFPHQIFILFKFIIAVNHLETRTLPTQVVVMLFSKSKIVYALNQIIF